MNNNNEQLTSETSSLNGKNEQLNTQLTVLQEEVNNLNFQLSSIAMQRSTNADVSVTMGLDLFYIVHLENERLRT